MISVILLLCLLQTGAFVVVAEPVPGTKPTPTICALSNIESVFKRYPDSAPRFCTSFLHYPTTTRTIHSTIRVTAPAKTVEKTFSKCTEIDTITYDTEYIATLPATTLTELDVTYTNVVLTFGGSFIEEYGRIKRAVETSAPTITPDSEKPIPAPVVALTTCDHSTISSECSSIAHHPTTRTIVHHSTTTPTTTVTVTSCTGTDYGFVEATETVPSKTFFSSGYKTKTLQVTTETVEYFCYSYGIGCVTRVPTPCCPGTCTDIGLGFGPLCIPTDPAEASSMFGTYR